MVERVMERGREPEPKELAYEQTMKWNAEQRRKRLEGKVVVRGQDNPFEQNRMGLVKFYSYPQVWDSLAAPDWMIAIHSVRRHSGKHCHQGGLILFILEGKGYSVVDGVRYDWEEGDCIILPVKPEGCEHQHFNANPDPEQPGTFIAFIFYPMKNAMGNVLEQRADSPDWQGPPTRYHGA